MIAMNIVDAESNEIQTEIVLVTPDMALDWLAHAAFEGQRTLRRGDVTMYASAMKAGMFGLTTITFVEVGGRLYLTDGQHRLHGVVAASTAVLFNIVTIRGRAMADVREDYARKDIGRRRSAADQIKGLDLHATLELSPRNAAHLAAAIPLLLTGFQYNPSMAREKAATLKWEYTQGFAPEARTYFDLIKTGQSTQRLYTAPAVAVALITLRYQAKHAEEFWAAVGMNDGLAKNSPEHTLITWLLTSTPKKSSPHMTARYIAAAWNAKFEGRVLSRLTVATDHEKPIIIRGTPFNGRAPVYVRAATAVQE